jgi:hypothetical protein
VSGTSWNEDTDDWDDDTDTTRMDSTKNQPKIPMETDIHKPEYYLQQIPKTPADIERSNELLAQALYNMVYIYRDKVGDQSLSDEAFQDFCRRFPGHKLLIDLYYMQYLNALKLHNDEEAKTYRDLIILDFPESKEAYIVSQPDYFQQLQRMAEEQDSLYESTYQAYCNNDFSTVKKAKLYVEEKYPLSNLMPRFLFLNAIAVAKTNGQPAFIVQLQDMVARYPQSELAAMAKDMLALMGQGAESQQGDLSSLHTKRVVQTQTLESDSVQIQFSPERDIRSFVILIMESDEQKMNQLLYEVALFNFSQFMIKDFDIKTIVSFDNQQDALQISGFEKLDEAEWYYNLLCKNESLQQLFSTYNVQVISITEENLQLIGKQLSVQEYIEWQKNK